MKFYEPSAGNLLIDHYEEHQLDPAEIRHFIGYVPQDVMLFQGTIKENIIYGAPPVDDSAIIRAARLATLDLFVGQHPDAFNRQVGEMGRNLSAGQRQAVIIARALLLDPSILVVDELTSALDDKTTSVLIERLRPVLVDKTLILVTHRASMLNLVDRLIVMDAGHVVADGPRDEIIQKLTEEKIQTYAPPPTVE
jgi:ATP-binding cassette subfamily C protein LapB